jgi:para-nitrobenzyl esterase
MQPLLFAAFIASFALSSACGDDDDGGKLDSGKLDGDAGGDSALPAVDAADARVPTVDGSGSALEVNTSKGRVRGTVTAGTRQFLGIPYAAPPVGDKRWKAPEPPAAWTETKEATSYGAICTQLTPNNSSFEAASGEDCLSLNVWVPEVAPSEPLPVMVWIHGGAYIFGSGGPPYNGETLVREGNVIVVTMNYRMGELGFLVHPAITAEARAANAPTANFGLLDQRLAMQWVRDNIAAFGGDRNNVTIFGESAGANSICLHLISEGSRGLFDRAIVESGLCMKPLFTLAEAEVAGERYATRIGCTDPAQVLSCLRQQSARAAIELRVRTSDRPSAPGGLFYQDLSTTESIVPVIDGVVLREQPEQAFAAGRFNRVPILHGITTSEGSLFHEGVLGDKPPTSTEQYQTLLGYRFAARAPEVFARYPDLTKLSEVTSEALFRCPARRMANYLSAASVTNYLYRFDLTVQVPFPQLQGKAFHSAELPYVFGNDYLLGSVPVDNRPIAVLMRAYWTSFAKGGDPNSARTPVAWPAYTPTGGAFLNFAPTISTGSDWGGACTTFWDGLPVLPP